MPKQKGTKKEMTKNKRTAIGDKDKDITNNYKNIPNKLKQNPWLAHSIQYVHILSFSDKMVDILNGVWQTVRMRSLTHYDYESVFQEIIFILIHSWLLFLSADYGI